MYTLNAVIRVYSNVFDYRDGKRPDDCRMTSLAQLHLGQILRSRYQPKASKYRLIVNYQYLPRTIYVFREQYLSQTLNLGQYLR